MKIINYLYKEREEIGIYTPKGIIRLEKFKDMIDFIKNAKEEDFEDIKKSTNIIDKSKVKIISPITRPIHDIICAGKNYRDHILEMDDFIDMENFKLSYFSKRASYILGDGEEIKGRFDLDDNIDYESELAIIIGKEGKNIKREEVIDYIFGFSIFNDLSSRKIQMAHNQWFLGKSIDNYSIMGPWIVTKDEFTFPLEINIQSKVNGEIRQDSNTKHMIQGIEDIIVELSSHITLEPGDIISTGTPAGVGMGFTPPKYLKEGDTVECIVEGIGVLKNKII
ncbi:fumarylacetoacetate hydrolase family protein [Tissierella creatinophila]|uniref:Ureidoglycolate lyase n=1 Tax=Tissierella creatinophila DSM 6911 TaxID=1123403 RepID=A0A1U7M6R8_TISCR|nr:fumarylacetoacetate hydrolase family protein [Tissierella creatinophila]OLS02950.1 ureidoglycolate lyase [Tissierella creatinophila DSM 6911]